MTTQDESIYMVCQHQALEITELKAKLSELEHENTMLIGEAEELKADNKTLFTRMNEVSTDWLVNQEKLKVAIEALEVLYTHEDEFVAQVATEALTKIKGE